ncbi:Fe-S oxidoreductase [Pyrobaculum oguniense TE7]|uniref:Fe-S oxidoreductase n=1 Tax=Pyrobaculum oguniense (strain DSM 13380 / JCM 10595 / TE7) TaxID=698757 RepID=H6Q8D6_PYROT|nr:Fe-S oxidoreductase [Pyrobaculum oguniense TE7]
MPVSIPNLDSVTLHYFENCMGCAACAPSCPYYYVDKHYAPVEKAEFLREILRKKYTISGRLAGRLVGAKLPKSEEDFKKLMVFAYRCANCGRCYTTCPYGIDSGAMVNRLRQVLSSAGYAPTLLRQLSAMEKEGGYVAAARKIWEDFLNTAQAPVEKKSARVLLMVSLGDILISRQAVLDAVTVLKSVGEDFTLPGRPLGVFPPVGYTLGDLEAARAVVAEIVKYVESLSPQIVVILNGCYTYSYFRFEATNILRRKFGFKLLHISELLAEYLKSGRLKLKKLGIKVVLQDSCQLARRGGVVEEPRRVLEACADVLDVKHSGRDVECLGGGAGIGILSRQISDELVKALGATVASSDWERQFLEKLERDYEKATAKRIKILKDVDADVVVALCPFALEALKRGGVEAEHFVSFVAKALW